MPRALSKLQRSKAAFRLEIDVTARCKKMLHDGVTASFNQLLRDGSMPKLSPLPILLLKVNVTASCNKLCCDG
jgi:hypothetical protein